MDSPATRMPARWEWATLPVLLAAVLGFGVLVEVRTAFLSRRMGDLDCYLRAAWAVTAGEDLYGVVVENGWHYNYPPLYAILMLPLADPPLTHDRAGYVPFPVAVALCYALNVTCLVLAVHLLAGALERHAGSPAYRAQPRFCRRWWALRLWPALVCLPPVCQTAMKGQVNLQVLALLCAWMTGLLDGRRARAGFCLALAVCIKVIPVYLLVYPLWRRDGRALAGCALGLAAGAVVVPAAVLGPARAVAEYRDYGRVLLGPVFQLSDDRSRQHELLGDGATDAVGVKNAVHNWVHPDPARRPGTYGPAEVWAYRLLGVLMTLAVLWPAAGRRRPTPWPVAHELGALLVLMVAFAPISHLHYYVFCLPLAMSLLFRRWEDRPTLAPGWPLALAFVWFIAANGVPSIPGLEVLKDRCLPLFGALPLWALGVLHLWRARPEAVAGQAQEPALVPSPRVGEG